MCWPDTNGYSASFQWKRSSCTHMAHQSCTTEGWCQTAGGIKITSLLQIIQSPSAPGAHMDLHGRNTYIQAKHSLGSDCSILQHCLETTTEWSAQSWNQRSGVGFRKTWSLTTAARTPQDHCFPSNNYNANHWIECTILCGLTAVKFPKGAPKHGPKTKSIAQKHGAGRMSIS